jgi:hypothetical protein
MLIVYHIIGLKYTDRFTVRRNDKIYASHRRRKLEKDHVITADCRWENTAYAFKVLKLKSISQRFLNSAQADGRQR